LGLDVLARFGAVRQGPSFGFSVVDPLQLAQDQQQAITAKRHHQLLEACSYFNRGAA
jgi:hypothetical protein